MWLSRPPEPAHELDALLELVEALGRPREGDPRRPEVRGHVSRAEAELEPATREPVDRRRRYPAGARHLSGAPVSFVVTVRAVRRGRTGCTPEPFSAPGSGSGPDFARPTFRGSGGPPRRRAARPRRRRARPPCRSAVG